MNILIYFDNQLNPQIGGTERVACMLADYLQDAGHKIHLLAIRRKKLPGSRPSYFIPSGHNIPSRENIDFVNQFIRNNHIDVIINEGAADESINLFSHPNIPDNVKIISHIHFDITGGLKYLRHEQRLPILGVSFKTALTNVARWIKLPYNKFFGYRRNKAHLQKVYSGSNAVAVLSTQQREKMRKILNLNKDCTIYGIPNPLTFNPGKSDVEIKENEILYVGRLDYNQKRVDRVLRVWANIQNKLSDWRIKIVGTGPCEDFYKRLAIELRLERIDFTGFANPVSYYRKAKILLLTSNFEGTPMVIPEAMAYGVIPVVMNSFIDAGQHIVDGQSGILIPPFSISKMAKAVIALASDEQLRSRISKNAKAVVAEYSKTDHTARWLELLSTI